FPTDTCGSEGRSTRSCCSRKATHWRVRSAKPTKSPACGRDCRKHWSKNVYLRSLPQPKLVRSGRAAVKTMRLGAARGGMNWPEKQAEITITAGLEPQALLTLLANLSGVQMSWPVRMPP